MEGGSLPFYFYRGNKEGRRRGRRRKMREVDSQAEKDAAEHSKQTDREEKVLEKNSRLPGPMQEAAPPPHVA